MEIKLKSITGNDKTAVVGKLSVSVGDKIEPGDIIVQLETKKGNSPVKSEIKAVVEQVLISEGQIVEIGQILINVKPNSKEDIKPKTDYFGGMIKGRKEYVETEIVIIGGGPGGYVAAIYASKSGKKVVLVEKNIMGGTCLNQGCIPTKAIVKSAEMFSHIKNANEFGIEVKQVKADMEKIVARKNAIKDTLVSGIEYLMNKNKIKVIRGSASFLQDGKISAKSGKDEYIIGGENTIIATGSNISWPKIPGIDNEFVMNSAQALDCKEDFGSITVIGGGVIGMEFASIYSNLGMKVNVVEYLDRVLTMVDSDISEEISAILRDKNIGIYTSSKVTKIGKDENKKAVVFFEVDGEQKFIVSDKVLVATGREANIIGLELQNIEVKANENGKGIAVDGSMRTSVKNIYAIGDVNSKTQLAHVASHEAIVAVDTILGEKNEMDYSKVPNVIFTSPEIASVGFTEDAAIKDGLNIKVSKFPFSANGRALTMGEPQGFVKIIKNMQSGKVIGGAVVGPEASALIGSLTMIIDSNISEQELIHTVFAHPTTGEAIHEAILGLGIGAIHYHE